MSTVLGYLTGSDLNLAGELIVLIAHYDGLGIDPDGTLFPAANHNASGSGILLEMARLWQEENLDPRRPVLFVAWGAGSLDNPGAAAFLDSETSFSHLPTTERLRPRAIFQLDYAGAGGDELFIHPDSDIILSELMRETAVELDIPIADPYGAVAMPNAVVAGSVEAKAAPEDYQMIKSKAATTYLAWNNAPTPPHLDSFERIDAEKLRTYGELLALTLAKVVRQARY